MSSITRTWPTINREQGRRQASFHAHADQAISDSQNSKNLHRIKSLPQNKRREEHHHVCQTTYVCASAHSINVEKLRYHICGPLPAGQEEGGVASGFPLYRVNHIRAPTGFVIVMIKDMQGSCTEPKFASLNKANTQRGKARLDHHFGDFWQSPHSTCSIEPNSAATVLQTLRFPQRQSVILKYMCHSSVSTLYATKTSSSPQESS